jgi:protein KRI1
VQEQDALRKETVQAFHTAVNVEEDEDEFLIPREKIKDDAEMEEEEYRAFLEREVGGELKDLVTVEAGQVNIIEGEKVDESKEERKKGDEDQSGKDKKKKKKKKGDTSGVKASKSKEEADQEFLMK